MYWGANSSRKVRDALGTFIQRILCFRPPALCHNMVQSFVNIFFSTVVIIFFRLFEKGYARKVIHIAPISKAESIDIHLVAITETGLFITDSSASTLFSGREMRDA